MQIVSSGDILPEMLILFSGENKKYINLLSAEFAQRVVKGKKKSYLFLYLLGRLNLLGRLKVFTVNIWTDRPLQSLFRRETNRVYKVTSFENASVSL